MDNKVTYRQQYTRCGKQRCRKCKEGAGHGPYWYAYWSEKGRTVSKYIGTHLPEHLASSYEKNGIVPSPKQPEISTSTYNTQGTPILRIYLLGQFRIEHYTHGTWQAADSRTWHRRRARALLGCLLSSSGRRLGREQVMEMLWPDLDIDLAANRLNGAVHELRQILEPDISRPSSSRLLRLERDILELADSTLIWVDSEAFEQLLKEAELSTDPQQAENLLEAASALYQGNYLLEELYSEWATPRRDALQRAWVGLQLRLTQIKVEQGAYVSAIEILDRLRTADPTNETALQRLMILLTHLDRRGEALQMYRQYVTTLQRDYEGEPVPETTSLYETLRKGLIPPLFFIKSSAANLTSLPILSTAGSSVAAISTEIKPVDLEERDSPLSYTRPVFQLGRQNQSPLIGRDQEQQIMQQLMLTIEQQIGQETGSKIDTAHSSPDPLLTTTSSRPRHTHFLLLRGEAGIGKTRLAEELSLEAYNRGWTVAWSRSYEQEGGIPYHPWTELLRTLLHSDSTFSELVTTSASTGSERGQTSPPLASAGNSDQPLKLDRLSALLPELAVHVLSARPMPGVSHEQERLHLWEATLGLLTTLSKFHPLLLVFDDLHWADDSSIELLTYLTHHLKGQRVLLIGTCRDGELAPQHKLRALTAELQREQAIAMISVHPLTQSQIGSLVSHLPENIISSIQTQSSGNPFFAEELARFVSTTLSEQEQLDAFFLTETVDVGTTLSPVLSRQKSKASLHATKKTEREHIPSSGREQTPSLLPDAIAALLERRLHRLSNGCRTLLGKAAVLGGSFELEQLLPMAPEHDEDVILDFLDEALHAGLLTEEGMGAHVIYHFWHPLIISHLYSRISAARRAQLHRRAADAIREFSSSKGGASPHLEKVAAAIVYHLSKGGGEPSSIAYYAEQAGDQAYTLASYSEAQHYYLQAIRALIDKKIDGVGLSTSHDYIRRITTHSVQQLSEKDVLQHYRLVERVAECNLVQGKFEDARHLYEYLLALRNRNTFQQQVYGEHPANKEQQQREAQIRALLWREIGNTWTSTGGYDQALTCYTQGKEVMSHAGITSGPAWACLNIQVGALLRLEGNYYKARSYLQDALDMLEKTVGQNEKRVRTSSTYIPKNLPEEEDHPTHAETQIKTPLTRTERALSGDPLEIGYAHERLGIVAASLGQFNDALEHIHTALTIYSQSELITEMARTCGNLGAVYIIKGDHEAAQTFLHRSLELSERAGHLPNITFVMLNLGDVAHRSGNLQEAEDWLQQSFALSEQINDREHMSWCKVGLAAVQADLGQLKEATISLQRAISLGREIKNTRCIGYALIGLADLRILQALASTLSETDLTPAASSFSPSQRAPVMDYNQVYRRFLLKAKATLQRVTRLEGMEVDNTIECKYLLALVHHLLFLQHPSIDRKNGENSNKATSQIADDFATGDGARAYNIAQQTLYEAEMYESPRLIGRIHHILGRILASQDKMSDAIMHFDQALTILHQRGLNLDYARTLLSYGKVLLQYQHQLNSDSTLDKKNNANKGMNFLYEARSIFVANHAPIDLALVDHTLTLHMEKINSNKSEI